MVAAFRAVVIAVNYPRFTFSDDEWALVVESISGSWLTAMGFATANRVIYAKKLYTESRRRQADLKVDIANVEAKLVEVQNRLSRLRSEHAGYGAIADMVSGIANEETT